MRSKVECCARLGGGRGGEGGEGRGGDVQGKYCSTVIMFKRGRELRVVKADVQLISYGASQTLLGACTGVIVPGWIDEHYFCLCLPSCFPVVYVGRFGIVLRSSRQGTC